jgi:hypothetical protein
MRNRPQILNLSQADYGLVRYAEQLYRQLEQTRLACGAPMLQQQRIVDGITMLIRACAVQGGRIILLGGFLGQIMLAAEKDGSTVFSVYDYLQDKISEAAKLSAFSFGDTELVPAYNRRCQLAEQAQVSGTSNWSAGLLENPELIYLGGVNNYEQAYFANLTALYVRVSNNLQPIALVPGGFTLLPELCGPFLSLFSFSASPDDSYWNLFQGTSLFSITPSSGFVMEYGAWIPSFFTVEPADPSGLKPGWYYGAYPSSRYDLIDPLGSLDVSLCAIVKTHLQGGLYAQGWCEFVSAVNGEDRSDLFFYFEPMGIPGNNYAYREIALGSYVNSRITIGSILPGFSSAFSLSTTLPGIKPDLVHLWNFLAWSEEADVFVDAVGVLIIEGKKLRGYRFKGYALPFIETDFYHSHTISDDGRLVAVFEAEETLISSIKIFDLYGEREAPLKENDKYLKGGYTLVRESAVVARLSASTGCFIPLREKTFTPSVSKLSSPVPVFPDSRSGFPSLSTLIFYKGGNDGIQIDKVTCLNGVDARFGISYDPCFSSRVVVDDPDQVASRDKLVAGWDVGGVYKGVVRGTFQGDSPNVRFYGEGVGNSPAYGVITLGESLDIAQVSETEFYSISGAAGGIASLTCLIESGSWYVIDPACNPNCEGILTVAATSGCGQSGSLDIPFAPPLTLSGSETPNVGSTYRAAGGSGGYVYSISCGTINSETGQVLNLTDCCGSGTVSATDTCGTTVTLDVRFPSGRWVQESIEKQSLYCGISGAYGTTRYSSYHYYGQYRTHNIFKYHRLGSSCSNCGWQPSFPAPTAALWTSGPEATYDPGPALCHEITPVSDTYRYVIITSTREEWVCL